MSQEPPRRRAPPEFGDADVAAIGTFRDVLAPYGAWIDDPRLGLVWTPSTDSVGTAFVPYATHGRWTYRSVTTADDEVVDEFVWVSDLPWGWVAFHYGRWAYVGRGWAWVPGRRYAGAWVDWRVPTNDDATVVGWGPTPPAHLFRATREGAYEAVAHVAFATPYVYAPKSRLFAPDLARHLLDGGNALAVAYATTPSGPPSPRQLGVRSPPPPPTMDRGLQQAWMLATPASAAAVGQGPLLGSPPHLRSFVAGGPRWSFSATR